MAIPKSLVGLFGLVIFVGWMAALLYAGGTENVTSLQDHIDLVTNSQNEITKAADGLSGGSLLDSLFAVGSITLNTLIIMLGFLMGIFSMVAGFMTVMLKIPFVISSVILAILSTGIIMGIFSWLRGVSDQ